LLEKEERVRRIGIGEELEREKRERDRGEAEPWSPVQSAFGREERRGGHSYRSFFWVILFGHSFGSFFWVILLGHSFGSFFSEEEESFKALKFSVWDKEGRRKL